MGHIFLSYSRRDEQIVSEIAEYLRSFDIDVWQDLSDIPHSTEWLHMIKEAIFTATGAVVFETEAWKKSVPCHQEEDMINKALLPIYYFNLDESQITVEEKGKIVQWCLKITGNKENNQRSWLMTGAYRVLNGIPFRSLIPKPKGIISGFRLIFDLRKQKKYFKESSDIKDSDIRKAILTFIKKTQKIMFGRYLMRFAFVLIVGGATTTIYIMEELIPQTISSSQENLITMTSYNDLLDKRKKSMSDIITVAESDSIADYYAARGMSMILANDYPCERISVPSDELSNLFRMEDSSTQYRVITNTDTGVTELYDASTDTNTIIKIEGVPSLTDFSDTGTYLAMAFNNHVFVTQTDSPYSTIKLSGCTADVKDVLVDNEKVYALLEDGEVLVWEIPWLNKTNSLKLNNGAIAANSAGAIVAAYVLDGNAIISVDGENQVISDVNIAFDDFSVALSSDGSMAAFDGHNVLTDTYELYIYSTNTGKNIGTWTLPDYFGGICFNFDNSKIAVGRGDGGIWEVDLLDGKTSVSENQSFNAFSITPYDKGYLVGTEFSRLYVLNENLEVTLDDIPGSNLWVPAKQVAVSNTQKYAYVAGRGGATIYGQLFTSLDNLSQYPLLPLDDVSSVSTNAVEVSESGDYVVYANADGTLYILDCSNADIRWVSHKVGESVIDVAFADNDSKIAALGSSGTVYSLELPAYVNECQPGDTEALRKALIEKARELVITD